MEIDELVPEATSDAPLHLTKVHRFDSSDDSDIGGDAMDLDEPDLLFTDAEGRSRSPLGSISTPPPHGNATTAESHRKKHRKRMREHAYRVIQSFMKMSF